ncbi:MAG TPA: aldehyde dehydrogenase family protein [Gemmatimonadota bacterium]|nr:aldehyde dehydrogenase family protein [Gemmatimonadota bacterium]
MTADYKLPVAGAMVDSGQIDEVLNPFNGHVVGRVPLADEAQREAAIAGAVEAFQEMRQLPRHRRAEICLGIAERIKKAQRELAETIVAENGKPIQFANGEVGRAALTFTIAAEEAKRLGGEVVPIDIEPRAENYTSLYCRFPVGPVLGIAPFNFPLNLVAHKVAPAIAAGCSIVLKPPQQAPITSLKLAELCYEAGLPPAALSVLHSTVEVAEPMVRDDRLKLLSFTGSAAVGWHLKSIAGKKKVVLELGGNAGAIVHSDADLEWAAERCVAGGFAYAGQVCISVQRVLVHRSLYDMFCARLVERTGALKVGDPMDEKTVVGPLIEEKHADRVMAWIAEAEAGGAEIRAGNRREGSLVWPTILTDTTRDMKVECEEIFGPVITVRPYDDFQVAVRLVNDSPYGLQAGVFTHDIRLIDYAYRNLEVGGVIVNDFPTFRVDNFPYGGIKDSGLGREGIRYSMEDMTEMRMLVIRPGDRVGLSEH